MFRSRFSSFQVMSSPYVYTASELLPGECEFLRQFGLTRWLSKDLAQAAVDFSRNMGLVVLYCETSPENLTRYVFWRLPQGAMLEVRSGRTREKFEIFDRANIERKWPLLTLHKTEADLYSG